MKAIPRAFPGYKPESLHTNGFTLDKDYPIVRVEGNEYVIINDRKQECRICKENGYPSQLISVAMHPDLLQMGFKNSGFAPEFPAGYFDIEKISH